MFRSLTCRQADVATLLIPKARPASHAVSHARCEGPRASRAPPWSSPRCPTLDGWAAPSDPRQAAGAPPHPATCPLRPHDLRRAFAVNLAAKTNSDAYELQQPVGYLLAVASVPVGSDRRQSEAVSTGSRSAGSTPAETINPSSQRHPAGMRSRGSALRAALRLAARTAATVAP